MFRPAAVSSILILLLLVSGAASATPKEYDLVTLADGVHAIVWREPLSNPIEGNVLIVVNEHDILVVDSSFLPSTARRVVAAVKDLTAKPVRYVVNTHWHNDHVQGNAVYRDAWPGAAFISHTWTRKDAREQAFDHISDDREQIRASEVTLRRWLAEGKDDSGKEIDDARRGRIHGHLEFIESMLEDTKDLPVVEPDLTFEDRLVLHRGNRRIEILHLGRGNTRGDVVVFLPQERIVATGDLVVHPEPFGFGSYYREWIDTLGRLAALEADVFVPGHGPVMRDRTYIETLRSLLGSLVEEVDAAVSKGLDLDQTKAAVTLESWKAKLAGDDEVIRRSFEQFFIAPAVERAWKQATDAPGAFEQKVR